MKTFTLSDQLFDAFARAHEIRSGGGSDQSLSEIETEIGEIRKNLATSAVIQSASKKLQDTKQHLADIEVLIHAKEAELAALEQSAPDLSQEFIKRGDLLAEIALGHANKDKLDVFDKQLEAASKKLSKVWEDFDKNDDDLHQMISGLKRKSEELQAEINQLVENLNELSLQAVLAVALDKAQRYTEHAIQAIQLYREVITLNETLRAQGWHGYFNGFLGLPFDENLLLPALNAPPYAGERFGYTWKLFDFFQGKLRHPLGKPVAEIGALKNAGAAIPELLRNVIEE